ncbi:MAG: helix-turn-helix transcriptional regulator [Sphingomonadales bacterium]|nr:helix-turn-helix transcriptional regulator [Sphingomonadales bacterium]
MPDSARPDGALAALNDKELEVLRLLALGHTVKSIAAQLGRSEASINERLRDARRKTRVGSSRELARQLDAQKFWDRKIDLPTPGSTTNQAGQSPVRGRNWSKGTIMMLLALPLAAAGLMMAAPHAADRAVPKHTAHRGAMTAAPLVGEWSLDVMRVPVEERPRKVTIAFRVEPDQKWTSIVEIVDADGTTRHAEGTAALDGTPVPITGNMDFIDSASLRRPAPNTLVLTLGKGGAPVSTRVYTVSPDGRSMTETIIWAGQSIPKLETNHFNRIG